MDDMNNPYIKSLQGHTYSKRCTKIPLYDNMTEEELVAAIEEEVKRITSQRPAFVIPIIIPCDCGTKCGAHHINCPQHPCNRREES